MIRRRSIVCADCGRSHDETPLRRLYPAWVPRPFTCRDCFEADGVSASSLEYPAWDDLRKVER